MKLLPLLWLLFFTFNWGSARRDARTSFIKSFLINEQTPTFLILCNVCWNENKKVVLANELCELGSRVSTSMKNRARYQDHYLLFLLDLDCPLAEEAFNEASSNSLFQRPYRWLVLANSTEKTKLNLLWNSPLLPDSELVLAEWIDDSYMITELHRPAVNHSMIHTPRGYFNGSFVDVRPHREQFRRRMDLMGHPLTMANVIQDSNRSIYHLPREDGLDFQHDSIPKVGWMNVKVAFLMLNATPRYMFSYRWGYKVNGQWSGMISDLHSGRADIGTNCIVSEERLSVVAYTDTLAPFNLRFIFRQPPLSYVSNIYSLSFSSNLWVGTAVCAAVSAILICVAARWELRFGRRHEQMDGSFTDAVFWTMSAVSQQGCDMEPRRTPGRIMECVVFTALMALFAAYSANIIVLLQAPSQSIKTLAQLATSKITLAANDVDSAHFIFKQYHDPVRVAIRKRIELEKGNHQFYEFNDGVERIRGGLFAFFSTEEQVYRRIEKTFQAHEKCGIMEIDFTNAFSPYSPMRKDSPYLELMRVVFKRMRETGVQSALVRRYSVPKPVCATQGAAFTSVGVSELTPVIYLMAIGAGTSMVVLVAEIIMSHMTMKMKKRPLDYNE